MAVGPGDGKLDLLTPVELEEARRAAAKREAERPLRDGPTADMVAREEALLRGEPDLEEALARGIEARRRSQVVMRGPATKLLDLDGDGPVQRVPVPAPHGAAGEHGLELGAAVAEALGCPDCRRVLIAAGKLAEQMELVQGRGGGGTGTAP